MRRFCSICTRNWSALSEADRGEPEGPIRSVIDNFVLALVHGLIFLGLFRLMSRDDLDDDDFRIEDLQPEAAGGDEAPSALSKSQQRQAYFAQRQAERESKKASRKANEHSSAPDDQTHPQTGKAKHPRPKQQDRQQRGRQRGSVGAPPPTGASAGGSHPQRQSERQPQSHSQTRSLPQAAPRQLRPEPKMPRKPYSPFGSEANHAAATITGASPAGAGDTNQAERG